MTTDEGHNQFLFRHKKKINWTHIHFLLISLKDKRNVGIVTAITHLREYREIKKERNPEPM